jgi:carbon starvation protein CstA
MMDKILKLTWKYFLQQKKEEIREHFKALYQLYAMSMIFTGLILQIGWLKNMDGSNSFVWLAKIGLVFIGLWILIGLIAIIYKIQVWLSDNWKKAEKKARRGK